MASQLDTVDYHANICSSSSISARVSSKLCRESSTGHCTNFKKRNFLPLVQWRPHLGLALQALEERGI